MRGSGTNVESVRRLQNHASGLVAKATLLAQAAAAKKLFATETVTPWAIYSKMDDATKLEVSLTEDIQHTTL